MALTPFPFSCLFSQIVPNESYTEFTVYLYDKNGSPTPIDSKKFQDVKNTDTDLQNAALNSPIWIRTYGKVFFAQLTKIMNDAEMFEKGQCLKFAAEMSHQVYKKMTFIDQSHYMIAFASIAENFANCFKDIKGNKRAIAYSRGGIDTLDRNRQCNAKPATDCQGFVNTCLYILGATYENINDQVGAVTEDAVIAKMKEITKGDDNIDNDKGIPWALYPADCTGYYYIDGDLIAAERNCHEPGKHVDECFFTVQDSEVKRKFVDYVDRWKRQFNEYANKNLVYGSSEFEKFLSFLKGQITIFPGFIVNKKPSTCVYGSRQYYSNGVRQILSNLHNLFDKPLKTKPGQNLFAELSSANIDCEGLVFISRRVYGIKHTYDKHGHPKTFRDDFADHVYIMLSGNRIAQSGGIEVGVNILPADKTGRLLNRSPYALKLILPEGRVYKEQPNNA